MPANLGNYSRVVRHPTMIVLHATDGVEGLKKDFDTAMEFARPMAKGTEHSAHITCDADSATRSIDDQYTAWHCGHRGNACGIGIELCGRASQTREQWFDEMSYPMLNIAARVVADLCMQWAIPAVLLDVGALRSGNTRGITTHAIVTEAWHETTHTDPGAGFPLIDFAHAVRVAIGVSTPPK